MKLPSDNHDAFLQPEAQPAPVQVVFIDGGLGADILVHQWISDNTLHFYPQPLSINIYKNAAPTNWPEQAGDATVLMLALNELNDPLWGSLIRESNDLCPVVLIVNQHEYRQAVEWVGWQHVILFDQLSPETLIKTIVYSLEKRQLKSHLNRVESDNRAKSGFLASMSHEIRTPMNGVMGMVSLLLEGDLTLEQKEYLGTIHESGEALLTLINDILDFSKIEAGRMELDYQPLDLRSLIESALDLLGAKAAENQVELTYFIDENVPARIVAPEVRLRQVLVNLIGNGVKFTQNGELAVFVSGCLLDEDYYELVFSIKDTGIGISNDKIDRLFLPYSQGDVTVSTRYGGTGLGLTISKRLVELMGGKIWYENQGLNGKGSTFSFSMRVRQDVNQEIKLDRQSFQPVMSKKRALVLASKTTQADFLMERLKSWGIKATLVTQFEDINHLEMDRFHFDVAVLDQNTLFATQPDSTYTILPKFDAVQLPVVLLRTPGDKKEILSEHDVIYTLSKPIKTALLYDLLRNIFTGSGLSKRKKFVTAPFAIQPGGLFPLRILLSEDNLINQKVELRLLQSIGYEPELAINGLEVLAAVKTRTFDVIFMDMIMPEMDGEEATRLIRSEMPVDRQPYIIALTANTLEEDINRYFAIGVDDYISKPIQINKLKNALQKAIQRGTGTSYQVLEDVPATQPDENTQAIDRNALTLFWSGLGEDTEKMQAELILMFLKSTPERLKKLFQLLKTGDAESVSHLTHTLKGESKTFGAIYFAELCKQLETMAKDDNLSHALPVFTLLEAEYDRVVAALEQILLDISK